MFSQNLKYYRLKNNLTKKELAEKVNVAPMTISHYESGQRKPSMEILKALASVLGVRVSDFLAVRNQNLVFSHGDFRKASTLSKGQQEYVRESVEEYFSRFMTVVEILGGDVLPEAPACHALKLSADDEENAKAMRRHLDLSAEGPIDDLIGRLEDKGILVYELQMDGSKFSGMNGFVSGRPYIVYNHEMSTERNRSTIAHELAHLLFIWPEDMEQSEIEAKATAISGAFLFPAEDAKRELGLRRRSISNDMTTVAMEYGISMMMLAKRAQVLGIVSDSAYRDFCIRASKMGWRNNEPSRIPEEHPRLFAQLVGRAVNEEDISLQRGAELLKVPYEQIVQLCCYSEV